MIAELYQGTPEGLKAKLQAIIATPRTINHVIPLADKSWYLILHS